MRSSNRRAPARIGRNVFVGLAVATAVEYVIATTGIRGALFLILIIAFFKAWLIVIYFMHVGQLRREQV